MTGPKLNELEPTFLMCSVPPDWIFIVLEVVGLAFVSIINWPLLIVIVELPSEIVVADEIVTTALESTVIVLEKVVEAPLIVTEVLLENWAAPPTVIDVANVPVPLEIVNPELNEEAAVPDWKVTVEDSLENVDDIVTVLPEDTVERKDPEDNSIVGKEILPVPSKRI